MTPPTYRRLDRIPTATERAAFDEIGLPPGCWAALYAAPLARIASKVMLQRRSTHYTTREAMWPWVYHREAIARKLAEPALQAVLYTPKGASAVETCVEWLRGTLPPLGDTVNGLAIEKAYYTHRSRLLAAIELLAWHLAKDIPTSDRQKWLASCAWSGILADESATIWPRTVSPSSRAADEQLEATFAQQIAEDLGKRVEFWVPERQYALTPKDVEQFDLMALIESVALLGVARKSNLQIQTGSRFGKLAASLGHQAPAFARWLKTAEVSRVGAVVPTDVFEEALGILATELAGYRAAGREAFIHSFHKHVLNCSQKVKKDHLAKYATALTGELRLAIQDRVYREPEPDAPVPAAAVPPAFAPIPVERPAPASAPPVVYPAPAVHEPAPPPVVPPPAPALPPPPKVEVIDRPDFVTVSFAECRAKAAEGSPLDAAQEAVTAELLFSGKPDGPKAVIVDKQAVIPDHLWFVGDIHADILSLENAWRFISAEAEKEQAKPHAVFLGDFIDRGQYHHETLVRLFRLIQENPGRIGVVVGNHDEALRWDTAAGAFAADVDPAEYKDELNALLKNPEGDERVAFGKQVVAFFARCPRAILLPDGTLLAHAGFPHVDLQEKLRSLDFLQSPECLKDFAWLRASRNPRKIPNRHTRGCEFGYKDFADFCGVMAGLGAPVRRLIRGHDHLPARYGQSPPQATHPIVTLNAMGRRLADEIGGEASPPLCVARHRPDRLPDVYRLTLDKAELEKAFPLPAPAGGITE